MKTDRPRFFMWKNMALYLGPGFETDCHAHYAVQVSIGLQQPLRIRAFGTDRWRSEHVAIVPSNAKHQLGVQQGAVVFVYLDPGHALAPLSSDSGSRDQNLSFFPEQRARFIYKENLIAALTDLNCHEIRKWIEELLYGLAPASVHKPAKEDPRIKRSLELLSVETPESPMRLSDISAAVGLSTGRFRHRFKEITGTNFTAFRIWQRLHSAVAAALEKRDLTFAAHSAGFADLAHFSRSFRRTFGVTPRDFFSRNAPLICRACPD